MKVNMRWESWEIKLPMLMYHTNIDGVDIPKYYDWYKMPA